jgi:hypothetical protein
MLANTDVMQSYNGEQFNAINRKTVSSTLAVSHPLPFLYFLKVFLDVWYLKRRVPA